MKWVTCSFVALPHIITCMYTDISITDELFVTCFPFFTHTSAFLFPALQVWLHWQQFFSSDVLFPTCMYKSDYDTVGPSVQFD